MLVVALREEKTQRDKSWSRILDHGLPFNNAWGSSHSHLILELLSYSGNSEQEVNTILELVILLKVYVTQ